MFYYDWTMILVIPGLLLGMWAQFKVKSAFDKYQRVLSRSGYTAASVRNRPSSQTKPAAPRALYVSAI